MRGGRQYRLAVMLLIAVFLYGCSPADIEKDIDRAVAYTGSYQSTETSAEEETTSYTEPEERDADGLETPSVGSTAVATEKTSVTPLVNTIPETSSTAVSTSAPAVAVAVAVPPNSSAAVKTTASGTPPDSSAPGTTAADTGSTEGTAQTTSPTSAAVFSSSASSAESTTASSASQTSASEPGTLAVADFTQSVSTGETASITVVGKPDTLYTITVTYKSGPSEAKGLEEKRSDAGGRVTWVWKVGSRTSAGSWPIRVSGGGEEITVYFQVV